MPRIRHFTRSFARAARVAKVGLAIILACLLLASVPARGYSVLSHEAIIDSVWDEYLRPLLLKRFPGTTEQQLKEAHAYAYGGCTVQDMGYYPFGSKFFSDLVHYVRSGDFVERLLADAQDANEYAFALGALAHYASDTSGHPTINRAVALAYPKLRARFGDVVTYYDNPAAHLKTEFGFDVLQVANGHYTGQSFHDFIGFEVSKPLLERAFFEIYGLKLSDVFTSLDLAIGTYRRALSSVIPEMTKVAWETKKDEIIRTTPGLTEAKFRYNLSRAEYEKEWGRDYRKPGPFAKVLAFLFKLIPKVGPLKGIAFVPPSPQTEQMFKSSFNTTIERYRGLLQELRAGPISLADEDLDTGRPTRPAEYPLTDETYARLLHKLSEKKFAGLSAAMRKDILSFYRDLSQPLATKKNRCEWRATLRDLNSLKAAQPAT